MIFLRHLFGPGDYQPHGFCYLWDPGLLWLHALSDSLIALSYFSIPLTLLWLVRRRKDLPFSWIFALFGSFIVACGATHVMEVWNLWHADYWLSGMIKALTAVVSVLTAILLMRLVPKALALPNIEQWASANAKLENEIHERRELELDLRIREASYREQAELLDLTHDAIFVRSLEAKILYWNRGAERLYGWQQEEARGKVLHELLHTEFPQPFPQIQAEVLTKGAWEGEMVDTRRDGSTLIVSSRWALRTDTAGKPVSILVSNRNISERRQVENKFRNLLESAPDAIVIVNDSGRIHLVNAQTEKLFGYSRDELLGMPLEILIPRRFHDDHILHRRAYHQAPRPRAMGAGFELSGRRKDGSEFPVEISLSPLQTDDGLLVSAAVRDISERKKTEGALRASDQRLSVLVQGVSDYAILMLDPQGRVTTWNEGAQRIKGYTAEEIIGQHFSKFYPSDALLEGKPARELQLAADRGRFEDIGWRVRKDGSLFWANVVVTALRDNLGNLTGYAKVTRDISERKLAEEELDRRRRELERSNLLLLAANKELEAFSYSVSHDLRAPLRHIDGFTRILREESYSQLSDEGRRCLDRVLSAATHMGHMVDDLLNLSRVGRREMTRQHVSVADIARAAMNDLGTDIQDRKIEWKFLDLPEADCDPGLLRLVFFNLFSNAIKFTRPRQLALIEVGTLAKDNRLAIFVRDNGVGFDPQYADKLFEVFQRLHRQEEFEGTGIGLATVQRIINRHGGEVWAESKLDAGTTVFFTLGSSAPGDTSTAV